MYSKDVNQTPLGSALINGIKIVMRAEQLRQLLRAHHELVEMKIGIAGKIGFLGSSELSAGWRSSTLQSQLVARGESQKKSSNHRRGVSVDSYKEDGYIEAIEPTMNKFGFFKSSYHPHHWNWISSSHARRYAFIDSAPAYIKSISMSEYENTLIRLVPSMGNERSLYALVIEGKRHLINMKSKKALEGLFRAYMDGMRSEHVDQKTWDSIPEGDPWDKFCR